MDLKAKIKDQVYIQWEGGDNAVSNRYNYAEWKQKEKIHSPGRGNPTVLV